MAKLHTGNEYQQVKAVVFDWAGTTVDFGCQAPARVFREIFLQEGIEISMDEARLPMGLNKKDHIRTIGQMSGVSERWLQIRNQAFSEEDVERMFLNFIPRQIKLLPAYCDLVPGAVEAMQFLREQGIRIGSSTGYDRAMMDIVEAEANRQGFRVDFIACSGDVPTGRPAPYMLYLNFIALQVYPPAAVIKIGDTIADIEEGLNGGVWSVGVVDSSNEMGLTLQEWEGLTAGEQAEKRQVVREKFLKSGAHLVVDSLRELEVVINQVNQRLRQGLKP
jgi:phosphonoacetaldehyde hydrolase